MSLVLTLLLGLHGAIHLFGVLKWSRLVDVPQLSLRTLLPMSARGERIFAACWLFAFALFGAAVVLRLARPPLWWVAALPAVLLSQTLVVLAWRDAKAATVANAIILMAALLAGARARFVARTDAEARALLAEAAKVETIVAATELAELPAPVRRWLQASGVVGRGRAATVHLWQRGALRTKVDGAWLPAQAEQVFSVDPPAFIWRVDATMLGLLPIAGRDTYRGGHGRMLIEAGALLNIVNAADDKIDLASMLRYLGEIIWFPSAALGPYVHWKAIDDDHARADLSFGGRVVSATFTFDRRGRVVRFEASRYLGGGADAKLTPWFATCSTWRTFGGIEVPSQGEVGWQLVEGPFVYYRWEIVDLHFNGRDLGARE